MKLHNYAIIRVCVCVCGGGGRFTGVRGRGGRSRAGKEKRKNNKPVEMLYFDKIYARPDQLAERGDYF